MPQVADKSAANLILDGPRPGQENFFLFFEKFFRRIVRLKKRDRVVATVLLNR
jgi:hypothetical protein